MDWLTVCVSSFLIRKKLGEVLTLCQMTIFKIFPNKKICADDKLIQMMFSGLEIVNINGKGQECWLQAFSAFPIIFFFKGRKPFTP